MGQLSRTFSGCTLCAIAFGALFLVSQPARLPFAHAAAAPLLQLLTYFRLTQHVLLVPDCCTTLSSG